MWCWILLCIPCAADDYFIPGEAASPPHVRQAHSSLEQGVALCLTVCTVFRRSCSSQGLGWYLSSAAYRAHVKVGFSYQTCEGPGAPARSGGKLEIYLNHHFVPPPPLGLFRGGKMHLKISQTGSCDDFGKHVFIFNNC